MTDRDLKKGKQKKHEMAPLVIIPNFEKINVTSANTLETRSPPGVVFVIDSQVYNSSNGFNWKKRLLVWKS